MWLYRKMLRISWTERVTNETVLQRAGVDRELMRMIRQRQLRFLGHVMRMRQLESVCVMGKVEGRRGRGRPRVKLLETLARAVGGGTTSAQLLQMTDRRSGAALIQTQYADCKLGREEFWAEIFKPNFSLFRYFLVSFVSV